MYPSHVGNTNMEYAVCKVSGRLIQPSNSRDRQKHLRGGRYRSPKRQHTVELLIVGSNANNGSQCGLSYANSNNGFSNANDNIGARLKIYTEKNMETQATIRSGRTVEPVSMEGSIPDRAKMRGVGYEGLLKAQQSPAVQVSKAVVRLYRKLGSREV